jgi:NAD(P)-dependent dehydrogenase (short-subunit alcohol dehydrogenase family)
MTTTYKHRFPIAAYHIFVPAVLMLVATLAAPMTASADTVLITGANSGIGLEFAKQYAEQGWTVIATHRRAAPPKSLTDLAAKYPKVRVEPLDVTNLDQAKQLAGKLADVPIDVLINNAGVYNDRSNCAGEDEACPGDWGVENFGKLKYSLLDTIMAVNIKGPLIVSETFYKNVLASKQKKIIAISSRGGTLTGEKHPAPGLLFYRTSKAALNREMQIVAASTRKDGVTVVMIHPGAVLTERQAYLAGKYNGILETAFTVRSMIQLIGKITLDDTGRFLQYDGAVEPW